jgi:hypothetical protein
LSLLLDRLLGVVDARVDDLRADLIGVGRVVFSALLSALLLLFTLRADVTLALCVAGTWFGTLLAVRC